MDVPRMRLLAAVVAPPCECAAGASQAQGLAAPPRQKSRPDQMRARRKAEMTRADISSVLRDVKFTFVV
jgi:hypothetical protein